jgi:hypothetical protein
MSIRSTTFFGDGTPGGQLTAAMLGQGGCDVAEEEGAEGEEKYLGDDAGDCCAEARVV